MTASPDLPLFPPLPHVQVVQASAGAGKTYSLGLRFLQLLARSGPPSAAALGSILALTFTVAAAQEMKTRIIAFLKNIALQTPTGTVLSEQSGLQPETARAWLDCILDHFQRLQVKTIDSLHFQLVQALGRRMGLWPELEASFDQAGWARVVLEGLLARTDWERPDWDHQSEVLSTNMAQGQADLLSLWNEIFNVYLHLEMGTGLRFLPWLERQARYAMRGLDQLLQPLGVTSISELRSAQDIFARRCRQLATALEQTGLADQVSRYNALELLADPWAKPDSPFFSKQEPASLFKKKALTHPGLDQAWTAYQRMQQAHDALSLTRARLQVSALARLQRLLMHELERLGQSQGLLLGGWWTRLIRQHLGSDGLLQEAGLILGAQWRHMLIDEFQDTSREQWEVLRELALEALSQGGSLFCVGDVKQAIYGWRGGDWRLFFDPLSPRVFPNVAPENRQQAVLPYNRRSCAKVVEWNNACFAALDQPGPSTDIATAMISAKGKDEARDQLGKTVAQLYARSEQLPWKECTGSIALTHIQAEDTADYKQQALDALVRTIQNQAGQGRDLGDIAVLVRTNAETRECAKALLGAGIATITEQSLVIAGHPAVRGLLALLTWLDDPGDDAALYALCGNTQLFAHAPRIHSLLHAPSRGGHDQIALYKRLQLAHPHFWEQHLGPFYEGAGYCSAYELLLAAVDHFQLRARSLGYWAWVEKFLESAFNAETQGAMTISAFLRFWEQNGSSCVVGLPEGLSAVRVLTMHKAKGLEFPLVILPLLGYSKRQRAGHVLLDAQSDSPYLAATSKPRGSKVSAVMDQEQIKTMAEELNLLYVAMTRAAQDLHVFLAKIKSAKATLASDWLQALLPQNQTPNE